MVQAAAIQATLLNCFTAPPPTSQQQLHQQQQVYTSDGVQVYNNWYAPGGAGYPPTYETQAAQPFLVQQQQTSYQGYQMPAANYHPQQYPPAYK